MRSKLHMSDFAAKQPGILVLAALTLVALSSATLVVSGGAAAHEAHPNANITGPFLDQSGFFTNATDNQALVNGNNAFFDPRLGTNGQACVTCHQPNQGFSLAVPFIQQQFAISQGRDP